MISSFTLAIVTLILSIALHFSLEHSKANTQSKPNTIILIRNGEPIQIDPRDIPQYLNNNYQRELPRASQEPRALQLDRATLEALASLIEQSKRYLPSGEENKDKKIMRF